jgi:hypothetical protein
MLALAVSIWVFAGCAHLPLRRDFPTTPAGVISSLANEQGSFRRYVGLGEMSFHSDRGSASVECRWEIRLPDTVRIRLYGPLGIRLGDMIVEGEHVDIFNYWLNQQDSFSLDSLAMRFPGMIALTSTQDLYPFPLVAKEDFASLDLEQSKPDSGFYVFIDSTAQRFLYVDNKYLIVDTELVRTSPQKPFLEKRYSAYHKFKQSWLPTRIRYSKGESSEWMEIVFDTIKIN